MVANMPLNLEKFFNLFIVLYRVYICVIIRTVSGHSILEPMYIVYNVYNIYTLYKYLLLYIQITKQSKLQSVYCIVFISCIMYVPGSRTE